MSRLGGFSFVCQIRRDKLLNLMQENGLTVQGNPLVTPFRLTLKGAPAGFPPRPSNKLDLLVTSIDLALQVGGNACTLILGLEGGVIRLPDEPDAAFRGGALKVEVQLVDGTFIAARILSASLDVPPTAVTAGIPNFAARANAEADLLVAAERNKDVDIYPDAGPIKQILILFSKNESLDEDTFSVHIGENEHGPLTSTLGPKTSVSYGISADVVRAQLPTAEQMAQPHVNITEVNYVFRDGGIDVNGKFDGHDTCWTVNGGSFSQSLIASLEGQDFVFTPDPPEQPTPKLDFELELNFLCVLGKAAIDFLDFAFTQAFFLLFGPTLAKTLGIHDGFVPPATTTQRRPGLALGGVVWNDFQVSAEGFLLLGDRSGGGVVSAIRQPAIHLRTDDVPVNVHEVGRGTVTVQGPTCAAHDFDYIETNQDDHNTLTVETEWLFEPIEYTWFVNGNELAAPGDIAVLGPGQLQRLDFVGTITLALPAPNGTPVYGHAIQLVYRAGGRSLTLHARHEDANYGIRVEVNAVDALGRRFSDAANLDMIGDIATFGQDYEDYMDDCVKAATGIVNKKGRKQGKAKPGEPQERWRNLVDAITQLAHAGDAEARALVPGLMRAVGRQAIGKSLARTSPQQS